MYIVDKFEKICGVNGRKNLRKRVPIKLFQGDDSSYKLIKVNENYINIEYNLIFNNKLLLHN